MQIFFSYLRFFKGLLPSAVWNGDLRDVLLVFPSLCLLVGRSLLVHKVFFRLRVRQRTFRISTLRSHPLRLNSARRALFENFFEPPNTFFFRPYRLPSALPLCKQSFDQLRMKQVSLSVTLLRNALRLQHIPSQHLVLSRGDPLFPVRVEEVSVFLEKNKSSGSPFFHVWFAPFSQLSDNDPIPLYSPRSFGGVT